MEVYHLDRHTDEASLASDPSTHLGNWVTHLKKNRPQSKVKTYLSMDELFKNKPPEDIEVDLIAFTISPQFVPNHEEFERFANFIEEKLDEKLFV